MGLGGWITRPVSMTNASISADRYWMYVGLLRRRRRRPGRTRCTSRRRVEQVPVRGVHLNAVEPHDPGVQRLYESVDHGVQVVPSQLAGPPRDWFRRSSASSPWAAGRRTVRRRTRSTGAL